MKEYILEGLALLCGSSLMLSVDRSKKHLTLLGLVCPGKPCVFRNPNAPSQTDTSLRLFSPSPGATPHPAYSTWGAFPSYMLVRQHPPSSIVSPQALHQSFCVLRAFTCIKHWVLNWIWDSLGLFIWVLLKQMPVLRFLDLLLSSQLVLAGHQLQRVFFT